MKKDKNIEEQLRIWNGKMFDEEDEPLARYLLYRLSKGKKIAQTFPYVLDWEKNLIDSNCVDKKTGKIFFNVEESGTEFVLLMNCALGYLKRVPSKRVQK